MRKDKATTSIISKLIESASLQVVNFIVGIILARLLSPSDYGIYSILLIFISIGQTFIISGFNSALIQQKNVLEEDFSSVFVFSIYLAIFIYILIFVCSPFISNIYNNSGITTPLRIISTVLFPSILYSLVYAKVARDMDFAFAAKISIFSVTSAGLIGIILAISGTGIWALVIQQILTYTIFPFLYCIKKKWVPKLYFNKKRFKPLFNYGSRILISDLINSVYSNIQGIIIGIKYNTNSLAFFNKGQLLPRTIMITINESIQSVLFPVYSDMQDDKKRMAKVLLKNMEIISFIVSPIMIGIFVTSDQIITILLTEKWIECSYIVKVFCIAYMFWPIDSMNLQAIKASGNGNTYLYLNSIKKIFAAIILFLFVIKSTSVEMFSISAIVIYISDILSNSIVINKEIAVSLFMEIRSIWKSACCASFLFIINFIPKMTDSIFLDLTFRIFLGIFIYVVASVILNRDCFKNVINLIMKLLSRKSKG